MAKRVAFLGPKGTFSEEAALRYDPEADLVPESSIPAVAAAVASGEAQEGVVPIENSLEGSVTYTLDILIQDERLYIRRELVVPIEHYLMVKPGTADAEIQTVYSHPQAFGQCREYLERHLPDAQLIASLSTVAAVEDMKRHEAPSAAISPRRAASLYRLDILAEGIQDNSLNATRFVVLATEDHPPTGKDKTSMVFFFQDDEPGLLHSVLGEFARRDINLAKVESRPAKRSLGQYFFLIDCEGHRTDAPVEEALDSVRDRVSMLRIFGSYPRWSQPAG